MLGCQPGKGPQDAGVGGQRVPAYKDAKDAVLSASPLSISASDGGGTAGLAVAAPARAGAGAGRP